MMARVKFKPGARTFAGLAGVAGWVAVAVLATSGSVAAVTAIGTSITGTAVEPLSPTEVDRELTHAGPPASRSASPSPSPRPNGTRKLATTAGGTVLASCSGGKVRLDSWSPAEGFQVDSIDPGPATKASLKFEADDREIKVEARCAGPTPAVTATEEED